MKKRSIAILFICVMLSLLACDNFFRDLNIDNQSVPGGQPSTTPSGTSLRTSEDAIQVESAPVVGEIQAESKAPTLQKEIVVQTNHVALSGTEYYQYKTLKNKEKEVYKTLVSAVKECKNVIGIKQYGINHKNATQIIQKVVADYPQFFYMSKTMSVLYNPENGVAMNVILCYTDGTVTDDIVIQKNGKDYKYVTMADRNVIAQKISNFNLAAEAILNTIPTRLSVVEKEKKIFDYITTTVTYDETAASSITSTANITGHAFDSYGALCEKKSVCEGYSELFQYLCYCVGINSTPISGFADGGRHMWNAVEIEGEWYQIDLTWGDAFSDNVPYYGFFNLTNSQMSAQDHVIDSEHLAVPVCTASENAFRKAFALDVGNGSMPDNYQTVLDWLATSAEPYLYVYVGETELSDKQLREYFVGKKSLFGADSVVHDYMKSKGYDISISREYSIRGEYYYFNIE